MATPLRIATVNVNGIRASYKNGMAGWLDGRGIDILALQEVRATTGILQDLLGPEDIELQNGGGVSRGNLPSASVSVQEALPAVAAPSPAAPQATVDSNPQAAQIPMAQFVAQSPLPADLGNYLDQVERSILCEALRRTRFNRTAAAQLLGLNLRQIRYRMERLDIRDPADAPDGPL